MNFSFSDDDPRVVGGKQEVKPNLLKMRTVVADLTINIHDVRYRTPDTSSMSNHTMRDTRHIILCTPG